MKLGRYPFPFLLLCALLFSTALLIYCSKPPAAGVIYTCPMHPQVLSEKPGDCPFCGMRLVPKETGKAPKTGLETKPREAVSAPPTAPSESEKRTLYRSTMNPNEVSDKPGKDSMGMEMVPFEATAPTRAAPLGLAPVVLQPDQLQRLGARLSKVEVRGLSKEVQAAARIVPAEGRLFRVTTKVEGWVDRLYVNATGQAVRRGEPLLTIYSPALVASQQELLTAVSAAKQLSASPYPTVSQGGQELVEAARRRLRLWDITDAQIERIEKTGQVEKTLTLYAPTSGYVSEKTVLAGQKVSLGDSLMVIADLSTVWAEASIHESDIPFVKVGMRARLHLAYWPGKSFDGKISFLNPFLDPASRTLTARLEFSNPGLLLRPEMYGQAVLSCDLGNKVAVPDSAVMHTGQRTFVYKKAKDGTLLPTEVTVGPGSGGYVEVSSGLEPGDDVLTSANFLIDSESSLKAALQAATEK